MLAREFTYEDFDGKTVTETWHFHISKADILMFDADYPEGLAGVLTAMGKTQNKKDILEMFQKIIRLAVGKRSEDGRRFIKTDDISDEFFQTPAWDQLLMELLEGKMDGAEFIRGIMPRDVGVEITNEQVQAKAAELAGETPAAPQNPQTPPPLPTPSV